MSNHGKKSNESYKKLDAAIKSGQVEKLYIFHGEEQYLLGSTLASLRALICPDGLDGFNYKRFEGKSLQIEELNDAINTLPVFAEKTLVEVHDCDIFNYDQRQVLSKIFSELPDYVCVVFVYSTIEYKPDGRQKLTKELLKHINVIEFFIAIQGKDKLISWINRHFMVAGKKINSADAEYLASITGGLMATLNGEIEKIAAFAQSELISRSDIDTVVTPVLDAVSYKLADAIVKREHKRAVLLLDELFRMREAPHKLMYSIALNMRQLLAARICIDNKLGRVEFMEICGIHRDFQARNIMSTAKNTTLTDCRNAVLHCSKTALELNSTSEPESRLIELVVKLAHCD